MLVLVALLCVYLGWAMNWIRQREKFLLTYEELNPETANYARYYRAGPPPFTLRVFGTKGIEVIKLDRESEEGVIAIREIFPEAHVVLFDGYPHIDKVIEAGSKFP